MAVAKTLVFYAETARYTFKVSDLGTTAQSDGDVEAGRQCGVTLEAT